jgi:ABC-type glycerol-3-phosphate transport system permease component
MKKRTDRPLQLALLLVASAFLLPQLWLFSLSTKTKAQVYEYPPRLVSEGASLTNYAMVLQKTQIPFYLWNSARVAVLATTLTLLLGIPAAYVLSREKFKRRDGIVFLFLAAQMVSPLILLVPIYGLVAKLHLLDTHAGLVLVYAAIQIPFTVVVLKSFFDGLPTSLFEAARLDGCSRFSIFRLVALPLLGPGLASVAIFNLAAYWSEFCLALVLLDSQARFTIPVGLFSFQSGYETEWHLVAAASFIGLLPVLLAFIMLQRFFVAGLTAGATKG